MLVIVLKMSKLQPPEEAYKETIRAVQRLESQ